ncbi:MAG: hypothetical protein Q8Q17_01405 [bacterium]|nr:hypothetical protein [bacterium]
MKSNPPDPKSPEEIARESLRKNLSLLSSESFATSALVYTNGDTLSLGQAMAVNKIIAMAIGNVQVIKAVLDKPRNPVPAIKDGS